MNNDAKILSVSELKSKVPSYLETIFSIANGHFGVRASDPVVKSDTAGTIVNGFYEISEINYGEKAYGYAKNNQTIVNLPDFRALEIFDDNGEKFDQSELQDEYLDMDQGLVVSVYKLTNVESQALQLTLKSVVQQQDNQIIGLRYEIRSLNYHGALKIVEHLKAVDNVADSDDPRKSRVIHTLDYDQETVSSACEILKVATKYSKLSLQMALCTKTALEQEVVLDKDESVTCDFIGVVGKINTEVNLDQVPSFDDILQEASDFWKNFWQNSEVAIVGNTELNQAILIFRHLYFPQIFFISILTQMNTSISYFNTFPIFFPYIFVRPLVFIFSVLLILSKIPLDYNINL